MGVSLWGANGEIPPLTLRSSNLESSSGSGTLLGGYFDWGGCLLNCNGGALRCAQAVWKSAVECKGTRELDCKTNKSSRCESRA